MQIISLLENTCEDKNLTAKHGLSIYINTGKRKVLFDLGPDQTYLHNAKKLGVEISDIDAVVISHGHNDHGGGLDSFLKANHKAKVYLHRDAFAPHFIKVAFAHIPIGLNTALCANERTVLLDAPHRIDDDLLLFADVKGKFDTASNRKLRKKTASGYAQDDFSHEQNLIFNANGKNILFSGCSHRGIDNILTAAEKHVGRIDVAVGGFHLYNPASKITEPSNVIETLTKKLMSRDTVFYTCHCTGTKAYRMMRDRMGDQLHYLSTGEKIAL